VSTTLDFYAHVTPAGDRFAANALQAVVSRAPEPMASTAMIPVDVHSQESGARVSSRVPPSALILREDGNDQQRNMNLPTIVVAIRQGEDRPGSNGRHPFEQLMRP
jgi:hypothetical protein